MKDLRLLQIIPSLESGGAEQATVDVANYVDEQGLYSIIASNGGRMLTQLNKYNLQHIDLPSYSKNPIVIFQNIKRIKKIILENNINIVHVRSRAPAWSVHYACKNLCRSVSTFHNIYGHQNLFKRYYNKSLSKVDKIVAISKFVKDSIIDIYKINKNDITVIYRGIDIDYFNPNTRDEFKYSKFISKFNISTDKKIILFPGRLTKWKGQIEFLNILLSLDLNNIVCYFIGDDKNTSYKLKLEKEIFKKNLNLDCKILGHLNKEDLRFMYKSADIIISSPLKPEGFGRIVSEGLAMKKIVLCYNFGGAKEQVFGLDTLYAVEPFDNKQMIQKIQTTLSLSENKINQMGEIAREHIRKNFSKTKMLENYFNLYQKLI